MINHGDTEITKRGAVDRTYKINKIYRILTDGGYRSALAFALRMERLKIPNPTSELAGMRLFTLPYPDESGLCAPIGHDFKYSARFCEKTHTSEALKVLILRPELSSAHLRCGINNGIGHG